MDYADEQFEALYKKTYQEAYFIALSRVNDKEIALDILQESYISILNHFSDIQDEHHFAKYLTKTINNKCIDYLKKKKPTVFADTRTEEFDLEDFIEDNKNIEFSPNKHFEYNELKEALMKIINQLPDEQKTCLLLYYYEQYSIPEIAEILDISTNTVKSRLLYSKKKIKMEIEELDRKGTKLFSITPAPLLLWLFQQQAESIIIPTELINGAQLIISSKTVATSITATKSSLLATKPSKIILASVIMISSATIVALNYNQEPKDKDNIVQKQELDDTNRKAVIDQSSLESLIKSYFDCVYTKDYESYQSLFRDTNLELYTNNNCLDKEPIIENALNNIEYYKVKRIELNELLFNTNDTFHYLITVIVDEDGKEVKKTATINYCEIDGKFYMISRTVHVAEQEKITNPRYKELEINSDIHFYYSCITYIS